MDKDVFIFLYFWVLKFKKLCNIFGFCWPTGNPFLLRGCFYISYLNEIQLIVRIYWNNLQNVCSSGRQNSLLPDASASLQSQHKCRNGKEKWYRTERGRESTSSQERDDHNIGEDVRVTPISMHNCEGHVLAQQIGQISPIIWITYYARK